MAIIKHTTSKNMSYTDVLDYFTYKHKEDSERGLYEPVLDENGLLQERDNYAIACLDPSGQDTPPESWWLSCVKTNLAFGKNQEKEDRKQHQYIISHPEEDRPRLTMEDLLEEGKAFARENLPGYDVLIAVHRDTDHDHIHICLNSVRAAERAPQPWMMKKEDGSVRKSEICAGGKHQDNPEFRRHYNDWLLTYTKEHGLTQKDNNAIAEVHKQERYGKRNQELADAIRQAAREVHTFPELVENLEKQKIFLLRRGREYCVLGPKNRNAVRLETLGIHDEEIPVLLEEMEQSTLQTQSREFLIEKRKYIEWIQERRQKNELRAEDALADAAALIAAKSTVFHSGEEFRELRLLLRQNIYVERDLRTELDKVDRLMMRWLQYQDTSRTEEQHRQDGRFIRWCGCEPDSHLEFQSLSVCRDMIFLQIQQVASVQQALKESSEQWRYSSASFPLVADPVARRDQISQKLSAVRANRKKLEQIAFRCEEAASRRIFKEDYLKKAAHFRELWHEKLMQEEALREQLRQAKKEIKLARGRGIRG